MEALGSLREEGEVAFEASSRYAIFSAGLSTIAEAARKTSCRLPSAFAHLVNISIFHLVCWIMSQLAGVGSFCNFLSLEACSESSGILLRDSILV